MEIKMKVHLTLYTSTELPMFHRKLKNQVIFGKTRLCLTLCDVVLINIFQIDTEILNHFIQSWCVTNMFILAKFTVTIFPCFFKHWTWLYEISLFSVRISTQLDWRFALVRIFNYKNRILDVVEMYSIINFILKCILLNDWTKPNSS